MSPSRRKQSQHSYRATPMQTQHAPGKLINKQTPVPGACATTRVTKELMYIIMNAKSLPHYISGKRTKVALNTSNITERNNSSLKSFPPQEAELVNWPSEKLEWWKMQKRRKKLNHQGKKWKYYYLMSNICDCHHLMVRVIAHIQKYLPLCIFWKLTKESQTETHSDVYVASLCLMKLESCYNDLIFKKVRLFLLDIAIYVIYI